MRRIILALLASLAFVSPSWAQLAFPSSSSSTGGSSTITAGSTVTSGITTGDVIGSTSNLVVDTGVAFANIGLLNGTQSWTGANTFTNSDIKLLGSSTGATTFTSANAGATNYTLTVPAATDTVAELGQANAFTGANTHTGVEDFSSTTAPTPAAGHLQLNGTITAPTLSANGEANIFTTVAGGLNLIGDGSSNDITLTAHTGSNNCALQSGANAWNCSGGGIFTNVGGQNGFTHQASLTTGLLTSLFKNTAGSGTASGYQLQIGNNTSSSEATLTLGSSTYTAGNGANSFTINGTGGLWLSGGASVNGLEVSNSGPLVLYNQQTTGSIVYGVCAASGANGTGGGALILDTSATVCGLSAKEFKNPIGFLAPAEASSGLDTLVGSHGPALWTYKDKEHGTGVHVGLYADDVKAMDPRCAVYDTGTGHLKNYDDRCVIAYLVADRQAMRTELKELKQQVAELASKRRSHATAH